MSRFAHTVWLAQIGPLFSGKCSMCDWAVTVFDFHVAPRPGFQPQAGGQSGNPRHHHVVCAICAGERQSNQSGHAQSGNQSGQRGGKGGNQSGNQAGRANRDGPASVPMSPSGLDSNPNPKGREAGREQSRQNRNREPRGSGPGPMGPMGPPAEFGAINDLISQDYPALVVPPPSGSWSDVDPQAQLPPLTANFGSPNVTGPVGPSGPPSTF